MGSLRISRGLFSIVRYHVPTSLLFSMTVVDQLIFTVYISPERGCTFAKPEWDAAEESRAF